MSVKIRELRTNYAECDLAYKQHPDEATQRQRDDALRVLEYAFDARRERIVLALLAGGVFARSGLDRVFSYVADIETRLDK